MKTWILIASASEAHCYAYNNKKHLDGRLMLELIDKHENPSNRKKEDDLVTGRTGSYRTGSAHGSYAPSSDPKETDADHFAKMLASLLDSGRMAHEYDNLVLIVPPHFQGLMNKHLKKEIAPLISIIIQKDYTQLPIKELEIQLAEQLP
jgi:protein required for attachment to host cells